MKDLIQKIRNQTGAGIMDIKEALEAAGGDEEAAKKELADKGKAMVEKRAGRVAGEGWIGSYVHQNGKIAALVKLACETDFVARNSDFRELAHDLAMHVAASDPWYVRSDEVPEGEEVGAERILLSQAFIKDSSKTIQDLVEAATAKIGEKIEIAGFSRMEI
ncbi:MAG: elongation factor Ts [Parcubacteria group bacterium]|nr:elongation factor Ts [Parcubacteria group bacterium]